VDKKILEIKDRSDFFKAQESIKRISHRKNQENQDLEKIKKQVQTIIKQIKKNSFFALERITQKIERKILTKEQFRIKTKNFFEQLKPEEKKAIELAATRIRKFHKVCIPENFVLKEKEELIQTQFRAIQSVGIYIPGGSAPLLSTVLMTIIPAQVAGVEKITVCSPPEIHKYILAVLDYLKIEQIYQIGGAQAIASMTYGIKELGLDPVNKIYGPGNFYVTLAKKEVFGDVGIDALYGPSELLIIADQSTRKKENSLAYDLMSQLEHGSGFEATCFLTTDLEIAQKTLEHFREILEKLENKKTKEKIIKAWENFGLIIVTQDLKQAIELANEFAPEHLELKIKIENQENKSKLIQEIKNAGAVFLGSSNEALGDYLAGPSHCLPTCGSACFSSGLSVIDFMKRISFVDLSQTNPKLKELKESAALLAKMEGLLVHAQAAKNLV